MGAETKESAAVSTESPTTTVIENVYAAAAKEKKAAKDAAAEGMMTPDAQTFSPELLKMYYDRLFPFELLHSWLSYDPTGSHPQLFSHREFSFTLDIGGEEVYTRHRSFAGVQELQQDIRKSQPRKIDIGAIYTHAPKDKNAVADIAPAQRELVFDIDLTDYDGVRRCGCEGASICTKCWTLMTMAVKVMDHGLRGDFGYEQIAWFYSGRRGVHAWVCDESARALTDEARSAVASYFEVRFVGGRWISL